MKKLITLSLLIFCFCFLQAQQKPEPPPPPPPVSAIDAVKTTITDDTSGVIYEKVDVLATFPAGEKGWRRYLENSSVYGSTSIEAERKGIKSGTYTAVVQFVVDIDGKMSDFKAVSNHGYGLEKGVIEIIKKSGKWTPAEKDNKRVKSYRKLPITFIF